jgi:hypothetical protein
MPCDVRHGEARLAMYIRHRTGFACAISSLFPPWVAARRWGRPTKDEGKLQLACQPNKFPLACTVAMCANAEKTVAADPVHDAWNMQRCLPGNVADMFVLKNITWMYIKQNRLYCVQSAFFFSKLLFLETHCVERNCSRETAWKEIIKKSYHFSNISFIRVHRRVLYM